MLVENSFAGLFRLFGWSGWAAFGAAAVLVGGVGGCGPTGFDPSAMDGETDDSDDSDDSADSDDSDDSDDTGAGQDAGADGNGQDEDSGGEPPDALDCTASAQRLESPRSTWVGDLGGDGPEAFVVQPGGGIAWIDPWTTRLTHWDVLGEEDWTTPLDAYGLPRHLVPSSGAQLVAAGHTAPDVDPEGPLQFVRFGADGQPVDAQTADFVVGDRGAITHAAPMPDGGVALSVIGSGDGDRRVEVYGPDFARRWTAQRDDASSGPLAVGLDGRVYAQSFELSDSEPNPGAPSLITWDVAIDAYDAEGAIAWRWNGDVEHTSIPMLGLSVGDHVYLHPTPKALIAITLQGEDAGRLTTEDSTFSVLSASAASPCGGVYLGGTASGRRHGSVATLAHLDADGLTVTPILDDPGLEDVLPFARYATVDWIGVSTAGDVVARGSITGASGPDAQPAPWVRRF